MTLPPLRAAALLLALVLGGCAALKPAPEAPAASAAPPPVDVAIEAPDDLRRLLSTHLDIARLAREAAGETLAESELRRLELATPAEARALLATEGFMDAQVRLQREVDTDATPPRPRVRVIVTPGTRTRVVAAALKVSGALADAAARGDADAQALIQLWQAAWLLPAGKPFSNPAWRDAKNAAIARLRAAGYAAASWQSTAADVDADTGSARLELQAASGPLFRTGALLIEGLVLHNESSARHLAGFAPGTPATESLLLDYQERLQRSSLFEGVSVTLDGDAAKADAAAVTVRLREAPLQQAIVGVGISANTGPRVSLEHLHRRIYNQRATLRNKFEWGAKRQAWEGELASHALPGLYRNLLGGAAERLESDTDVVTSTRVRVGRTYDTQRIERLVFAELERVRTQPLAAGQQAQATRTEVLAGTLNFQGAWRDMDSLVLPTDGRSIAVQTGIGTVHSIDESGATGAGSGPFSRLHLRGQWWLPFGERWYGYARLEAGQVFAEDDVNVPETQRFRAGGDESVRGYAWRSLTPQVNGVDVGGRVVATASIEVARPVSEKLPSVWWATFVDAGNAAENWSGFRPAWGAGVGVRWRSPVGPLRADLAYGDQEQGWRLHLSVGIAY
jgi:translocation and assembly module TamA